VSESGKSTESGPERKLVIAADTSLHGWGCYASQGRERRCMLKIVWQLNHLKEDSIGTVCL